MVRIKKNLFSVTQYILNILNILPSLDLFLSIEFLHFLVDILRDDSNVLVSQLHPAVVIVIQDHLLHVPLRSLVLVDIILDVQKIQGHGLEGELVQESCGDVETSVQDDQLRLGLLCSLSHAGVISLVSVQLLLHQLRQLQVLVVVSSVSDGGILSQSRAESRYLLRHSLHGSTSLRGSQRVVVELEVVRTVETVDLGLVRSEGNVDLLQCLDPLGSQRVANLLESIIRTR